MVSVVHLSICVANKIVCVFSVFPGMFGLVFGLFGMLAYDGERLKESGMFQGYNMITWTVVALQVTLTPITVTDASLTKTARYIIKPLGLQTVFGSDSPSARTGHASVHLCPCVCCFSRHWVVWSLQRSSSMPTTSSKALQHRSPSFCQLSYRTSGCRTSTPLGRRNTQRSSVV